MNLIFKDVSYELIKTESAENYVEYDVMKDGLLLGQISRYGAEILYTARDAAGSIKGTGATIREALESMVENIFYFHSYKGERRIKTLGEWIEGAEVKVEYVRNEFVKHGKRVVRYDKAAGDLFITIDNNKYFYYEFE